MIKNNFFKSVGIVALGTLLAQVLGAAMMPVLTRLYGPSEFSEFSEFISFVYILSAIVCLRFDVAIPISNTDQDAKDLMALSIIVNLIFSILAYFLLNELARSLDIKNIEYVSLCSFLIGVMNTFHFYLIRLKHYTITSKCKVLQILAQSVSQVVLFYVIPTMGLIFSQVVLTLSGIIFYGFILLSFDKGIKLRFNNLKKAFSRYSDYPKYSTLESLANVSSIYLPIVIISNYSDSNESGYILLAMKLLQMPLGLIGNSIAQVYISEARIKCNERGLYLYSKMVIGKLAILGGPIIILIGIVSPFSFKYIFGSEWAISGYYALYMTPWFIMQFITSPISMALYAIGKQKISMILQLFGLVVRCSLVIVAILFFSGYVPEFYFISGFIFYTVYFIVVIKSIKKYESVN